MYVCYNWYIGITQLAWSIFEIKPFCKLFEKSKIKIFLPCHRQINVFDAYPQAHIIFIAFIFSYGIETLVEILR